MRAEAGKWSRASIAYMSMNELAWQPRYDFKFLIDYLRAGEGIRSPLARLVGSKGYRAETFADGPYPVE
jgi:UDP-glucose 4-epimerase